MRILRASLMALSMFSITPCPSLWHDDALPWVIPFFPFVGAILGGLWFGLACLAASWPMALSAFVLAALPWVFSGLMHLDGMMDVSDALLSRRDRAEMLRILKDPHTGAFAVISVALLLLGQYSAAWSLTGQGRALWPLLLVPVWSRAMSAGLIQFGTPMPSSGYAKMLHAGAGKPQRAMVLATALLGRQWQVLLSMTCAFGLAAWWAIRKLGGVNGDIAGFSLTLSELAGLMALAVRQVSA
ncbi:MAG TPA: adenosylcobinamide-GDP ribazoletransferase [Clostridia bacterium]|nr:adenosylcobinamide-GDP ribazoletransferase [Clostridia bacterium]